MKKKIALLLCSLVLLTGCSGLSGVIPQATAKKTTPKPTTATLLERVKALESQNQSYSTQINTLKSQIAQLQAEIASLKAALPIKVTPTPK